MIIEEIKDDILNTKIKHIAHGVNCQNTMGSGVARALFMKYPNVKASYHTFFEAKLANSLGLPVLPQDFLGEIDYANVHDGKIVLNMFTQENFGGGDRLYLSYEALEKCFQKVVDDGTIKELAIPKIGCGLAGGDWDKVKKIINKVTGDDVSIVVYYI
jgi:O-acetyl-ADP-ribose deacetylase (regulator of RNase III)